MAKEQPIETTITIEKGYEPDPGKATVNLKATDGKLYRVPVLHRPYFHDGGTYRIGYRESYYQGKTFRFISEVDGHVLGEEPLQGAQKPAQTQIAHGGPDGPIKSNAPQQAPQPAYGAITEKDKLIWLESYVKSLAIPGSDDNDGRSLTVTAIHVFDTIIQPWLEGRTQDGPGDKERAVKGGDQVFDERNPAPWDDDDIANMI